MRIILCCGESGRAVVYGTVESEPVPGEPVRLTDARMILRWTSTSGLFGLVAAGPTSAGTRITPPVSVTTETTWREWISVSQEAAEIFDAWPSC